MTQDDSSAWRCSVCGYVHRGAQPPEWCPVCGAAAAEFEPYVEAAPAAAPATRWRCLNCGYLHEGPAPPDECPVCGAAADCFEARPAAGSVVVAAGRVGRVVVAGAGIAGLSAVESLRGALPDVEICLISKEAPLPYYRLNLTRHLAGQIEPGELPIHPAEWYADNRVELLAGAEVAALRLDEKAVELRGGALRPFDKLILTVGGHPFVPPLPGVRREGVTALRTIEDADRILDSLHRGIRCACVGGGLLGLETAGALAARGADVTLLESHGWLMPRQLNRRAGEMLAEHVTGMGITLLTEARSREILGDERAAGVLLEDGRTVPADLVVIATGVRPNSHLARRAGLEVNRGVVVDNHLLSSDPEVLVAGDVAEHRGNVYGNWSASQFQGRIAGLNAAGAGAQFGGIPRANTLKVLGLDLMSIGTFEPEDGSFLVIEDEAGDTYARFVFHDGVLVGAVMLGDTSRAGPIKKAIENRADFSDVVTPTGQAHATTVAAVYDHVAP